MMNESKIDILHGRDPDDILRQKVEAIFQAVLKYCDVYGANSYNNYNTQDKDDNHHSLKQLEHQVNTFHSC